MDGSMILSINLLFTFSAAATLINGPWVTSDLIPSPTLSCATAAVSACTKRSWMPSWTNRRLAQTHVYSRYTCARYVSTSNCLENKHASTNHSTINIIHYWVCSTIDLSKYVQICCSAPKTQLDWPNMLHSSTPSDCQRQSGQIPGDQCEQGIDDYRGKDFEKKKVSIRPQC